MKKIIVSLFLIFSVFVFLPKAEAQPSACHWLNIFCGYEGQLPTFEQYCVNADANTNNTCGCGAPPRNCMDTQEF